MAALTLPTEPTGLGILGPIGATLIGAPSPPLGTPAPPGTGPIAIGRPIILGPPSRPVHAPIATGNPPVSGGPVGLGPVAVGMPPVLVQRPLRSPVAPPQAAVPGRLTLPAAPHPSSLTPRRQTVV